jgi:hypothetical protein
MAKLSPTEQERLRKAFQTLTAEEAGVLWSVLAAHVENELCNDECEGDPSEVPDTVVAQGLLDRVEMALVWP